MSLILRLSLLLFVVGSLQGSPTVRKKGYGPGEQEWGFIDVRKGAHMFYWLFFVQDPKVKSFYDRPLVVWLQGGPGGSSSAFGNFEEIGPLFTNGTARPTSWAKHVNLLFIDNPVGAGFSYVDRLKDLTTTNEQIGNDMVNFLIEFYKKFPKFEKSPFYIFSESYGGKMTVEISKQLLEAIKGKKINMNFKGVGLGDPWISPIDSVLGWASVLAYTGLSFPYLNEQMVDHLIDFIRAIEEKRFAEATDLFEQLEYDIMKDTSNVDFYNIMYKVQPKYNFKKSRPFDDYNIPRFGPEELQKLMEGPVKKALGIPSNVIHNSQSGEVFRAQRGDFTKPVVDVVSYLLNNTNLQVVVFSGNLDLIVEYIGTARWLHSMPWKNSDKWVVARQEPLVINGYIEGYIKHFGNLYHYVVHRAGHMVPTDNPYAALEILRRSTGYDKL